MGRTNKKEMLKKSVKASLKVAPALVLGASFMGGGQVVEASEGLLFNVPEQVLADQQFIIQLPGTGYSIDFSVLSWREIDYHYIPNNEVEVTFYEEGTYMINLIKDGTWIKSYPIVVNNHTIRADHDHDGLLDIGDIVRYAKDSTLLTKEDINEMLQNISSIYATENRAPIDNGNLIFAESYPVGYIAEKNLYNSGEVYFSDPDEDDLYNSLTYTVTSENQNIAEAWMHNGSVMVKGKVVGSSDITITAYDWLGKSVSRVLKYNVTTNNLPYLVLDYTGITKLWDRDWSFTTGSGPAMIDLSPYFADPNGYELSYSFVDPEMDPEEGPEDIPALVTIEGKILTITPIDSDIPGYSEEQDIHLRIENSNGEYIKKTITINVYREQ